ncbi:MAG TPA: acetyl-CoA C-acyltransferase [Nannocystaceae bacterium]|nr:acetyl-CoA C-acyltransferase [Nannocystaceae bacterium]
MVEDARTPVIVDAIRTPIGRLRGALASMRPDDLAAHVVRCLTERNPAAMEQLEDVIFGAANGAGEDNRNVARMAVLLGGLPVEIPGATVNRLCGSGMEALLQTAKSVISGEGEVYIAGGVESMTRAPFVMPKADEAFPRKAEMFDTSLGWRMINPAMQRLYPIESLGETAENVAERYSVSREDQDAWALDSHKKAATAQDEGWFDDEISPVEIPGKHRDDEPTRVTSDEGVRRDSTIEKLAKLPAAFKKGGTVTAGNSSTLNDGASALLVTSMARARALDLQPLARIVSWGHAGVHPGVMGIGPVPASRKALERAGLRPDEIDVAELNEAFASQVLASLRALELDPAKVNLQGGAIALGHPLGCSGARIVTTLVHGLHRTRGRYGLATMCIGVGQGIACVIERL